MDRLTSEQIYNALTLDANGYLTLPDDESSDSERKISNEFILQDRIQKIQQTINKYGESNFYVAFSGGKDSSALSHLLDMALPNNSIPRVYVDTGIELNMIRDFVKQLSQTDDRIIMLKPTRSIIETLNVYGYPFKSKMHSKWVDIYQRHGMTQGVVHYLNITDGKKKGVSCPKCLEYQFTENFDIKISPKCCIKLKEEPMKMWSKQNKRRININGIMREEGGQRSISTCLVFKDGKLNKFQPLSAVTKEFENWFIEKYDVKISDIYKPPYNLVRTGCKGCPFALNLQNELNMLEKFFPAERKQCEIIWKPIYEEYRRIGYRLKNKNNTMLTFDD